MVTRSTASAIAKLRTVARSTEIQRKPVAKAESARREPVAGLPGARVEHLESMQAMLDRRPQSLAHAERREPAQRRVDMRRTSGPAAAGGPGAGVVQRVINLTKESVSETPEQLFERIKNSRAGKKYTEKWGLEGLLVWLKAHDGRTYASSNALQSELTKSLDVDPSGGSDTKLAYISKIRELAGPAADIVLGDSRRADELYYKLALARALPGGPEIVQAFLYRLVRLAKAVERKEPVDIPGIQSTLRLLTSTWAGTPTDYLDGDLRDSLFGKNEDGIGVSIMGLTSELDAILNVDPSELAKGEVVFSGSNYTDSNDSSQTKDVDVSYIDRNETLHLIESAKDMNTLYNKVVGKHDQKSIYSHLTYEATSLDHTAVGPLTEQQAQRDSIDQVQWWYSVPPETLDLDVGKQKVREIVVALVKAGAGLRSGNNRYPPETLAKLLG